MNKRLSPAQSRLVEKMKDQNLHVQHGDPPLFLDSGEIVNGRTVRSLLARGVIASAGDGLFDGDNQTYMLVRQ